MITQVTAKDGKPQKFSYYHVNTTGKHVVRFYISNYIGKNGKKKSQWTGRGCQFNTIGEAVEFGTFVAQNITKSNCQITIKQFVNALADYNKAASNLEEFLCA